MREGEKTFENNECARPAEKMCFLGIAQECVRSSKTMQKIDTKSDETSTAYGDAQMLTMFVQ